MIERAKLTDTQKKLARAMQFCGDVAKLYKKHGQPPKWISRSSEISLKMRMENQQRRQEAVQARRKVMHDEAG